MSEALQITGKRFVGLLAVRGGNTLTESEHCKWNIHNKSATRS